MKISKTGDLKQHIPYNPFPYLNFSFFVRFINVSIFLFICFPLLSNISGSTSALVYGGGKSEKEKKEDEMIRQYYEEYENSIIELHEPGKPVVYLTAEETRELLKDEADLFELTEPSVYMASRKEEKAALAPSMVTIVSAKEIEGMGARTLTDVLQTVVGFDIKKDAEGWGREVSRNQKTEFIIHNKDGKISRSDSHGNDPCPPKDKR